MVDVERLSRLLDRIAAEQAHLARSAARPTSELMADEDALPAVKYRLIVAIETATDVAEHIIATSGFRPSDSFADSFHSLREAGWLTDELATRLADAARFRNLLVHQYADIDDQRVLDILRTRLVDLDRFVATIAERLRDDHGLA